MDTASKEELDRISEELAQQLAFEEFQYFEEKRQYQHPQPYTLDYGYGPEPRQLYEISSVHMPPRGPAGVGSSRAPQNRPNAAEGSRMVNWERLQQEELDFELAMKLQEEQWEEDVGLLPAPRGKGKNRAPAPWEELGLERPINEGRTRHGRDRELRRARLQRFDKPNFDPYLEQQREDFRAPARGGRRDKGKALAHHPQPPALAQEAICASCFEPVTNLSLVTSCKHKYCLPCLEQLITASLSGESGSFPPQCCTKPIPPATIRMSVSQAEYTKYTTRLAEVQSDFLLFCPVPKCARRLSREYITGNTARCPDCRTSICVKCKQKSHRGDCPTDRELRELAQQNGWKECPKCSRMVEKKRGTCNSIRCLCGEIFCYLCGKRSAVAYARAHEGGCDCPVWSREEVELRGALLEREVYEAMNPRVPEGGYVPLRVQPLQPDLRHRDPLLERLGTEELDRVDHDDPLDETMGGFRRMQVQEQLIPGRLYRDVYGGQQEMGGHRELRRMHGWEDWRVRRM